MGGLLTFPVWSRIMRSHFSSHFQESSVSSWKKKWTWANHSIISSQSLPVSLSSLSPFLFFLFLSWYLYVFPPSLCLSLLLYVSISPPRARMCVYFCLSSLPQCLYVLVLILSSSHFYPFYPHLFFLSFLYPFLRLELNYIASPELGCTLHWWCGLLPSDHHCRNTALWN